MENVDEGTKKNLIRNMERKVEKLASEVKEKDKLKEKIYKLLIINEYSRKRGENESRKKKQIRKKNKRKMRKRKDGMESRVDKRIIKKEGFNVYRKGGTKVEEAKKIQEKRIGKVNEEEALAYKVECKECNTK